MDTYLDRLELHGFKSFPDKTVIKFHQGITAVVGPNGCGKSNIVDSLLWVLGEQRIKNLRGENTEDLIFNGSSSKKPLGMTEVGAFFNDQTEEVYIARRFFRTGEGKYILNERYCRGKDIQDTLFKLRLGGRNYFIFEQGSIEKLVSLKPSEKRMLIEEAAGISQYLIRKKETANKLIIAEQNLENIQVLLTDKEGRLKDLRRQVSFVQRYRRIKNDKVDYLKTLLKKKESVYREDFEAFKTEIETLINHETVASREINALEKDLLKLEEDRWLVDKELKKNQQEIYDYNKKILSAKSEIDRSKQGRGFKNQRKAEILQAIDSGKKETVELEKQAETTRTAVTGLEASLKKESSGHDDMESRLLDLNDRLESIDADNSGLKSDIFNVQGEMTRQANKVKEIDKRMGRIENEVVTKQNFIAQLSGQVSGEEIQELEKKDHELTTARHEEENRFKEAEANYNENKHQLDQLSGEAKNCKNEIRGLENQHALYLEIKKKIEGQAVKDPGVQHHGFLQNLMTADKKHHKPLENFYFEEMDAPLVDQYEALLHGELSVSKFQLKPANPDHAALTPEIVKAVEQEPGFTAWVKDLFSLKQDAPGIDLKAFFKNGALVDNLQHGLRIFARYGVDVVTENAETVSRHGLLVRSREKGILDVIDEIRDIKTRTAQWNGKAAETKRLLEKEREKQPQLAQRLDKSRNRLREMEKQSMQFKSRLETLKKNRDTNMKRVQFTQSEIQLLETEKEKLQEEFEILDISGAELQEKFQALNERRERFQEETQVIKEEIARIEKSYLQKENTINLVKEKINSSSA
jgi:chromosome segregation protein